MKLAAVCSLALLAHAVHGASVTSYKHDVDWLSQHGASKSPYPKVPSTDNITETHELVQLQIIKRHGSRYPSEGDTADLIEVIDLLKNATNPPDWIKDYENPFLPRRAGSLDQNGQYEHYDHGRRVAKNYPDLVQQVIDGDTIVHMSAYSSFSNRTSQSAAAFQLGLFQGDGSFGSEKFFPAPLLQYGEDDDTILALDGNCPNWKTTSGEDDGESDTYRDQAEAPIAERLSKELGANVTVKHVDHIYTGCVFEVSHRRRADTFCSLLSKDDILINEYREDLEYYYGWGPGNKINSQVACATMQDVMANIDAATKSNDKDASFDRIAFKAGHRETIMFMESFLGLFQDDPVLQANSTQSVIDNRQYRASNIGHFAVNFTFQLLRKDGKFYIRTLLSERPITIPGCKAEICPLDQFKAALADKLKCNVDQICGLKSN
ncbi:hypothetical protein LRAMOSA08187 [Lichtheimia ramosa]|uniref:Multiple inositol polyphosphate phosphatase 1 n=1 Tax=Lichtheimia ramosa TaxID=688394 RepID=A0A077WET4_9FUNG|nr:hypothetical protein LRAMOSA08187 [Lichtheimia ramosa]